MRHRFQQQTTLGITPISEVYFPLRSRDELPPVLMALQHIFVTPVINEKVFALHEKKVLKDKKKTGRKGMDLWHTLVELGHLLLITTDQHQLIVDYKIMEGEKDAAQIEPLKQRIQHNYAGKKINGHNFDKGFLEDQFY